ncbi:MAG: hypothetical protein GF320_21770 [Armatimonadia bacterium]|nr:hypothetical protein [Armatimonadia bacterium]
MSRNAKLAFVVVAVLAIGGVVAAIMLGRSPAVRRVAGEAMVDIAMDEGDEAGLVALLESGQRETRWRAAEALLETSGPEALIAQLDGPAAEAREVTAGALYLQASNDWLDRINSMVLRGQDPPPIRETSAVAPAIPRLIELLGDESGWVRIEAMDVLVTLDADGAEPALIECLSHELPDVRARAAQSLGHLGSDTALGPLRELTSDPDWHVSVSAEIALEYLATPQPDGWDQMIAALATHVPPYDPQYEAPRGGAVDQWYEEIREVGIEAVGPPPAMVTNCLQANQHVTEDLRGLRDDPFVWPQPVSWLAMFPSGARLRGAARVLNTEAMLRRLGGDDPSMLEVSSDALMMSVQASQTGSLIPQLIAIACAQLAVRPICEDFIHDPPECDADDLLRYSRDVRGARDLFRDLALAERHPALEALDHLRLFQRRGPIDAIDPHGTYGMADEDDPRLTSGSLTPDAIAEAKRWLKARMPELMAQLRRPYYERESWVHADLDDDVPTIIRAIAAYVPYSERTQERHAAFETQLVGVELIAAIEAYRISEGAYPETLDQLAPGFVPDIPVDPWTGEALVYRRDGERYLLYSVGPDGVDDGGVSERPYQYEPDQVLFTVR